MPRCLSEGVDIFLKSAERQGGANRTFATGGRCHGWQLDPCPYGLEPLYHFSLENSHLETRHQGVMFRSLWAFVVYSLTLNYSQYFNNSSGCAIIASAWPSSSSARSRKPQRTPTVKAPAALPVFMSVAVSPM